MSKVISIGFYYFIRKSKIRIILSLTCLKSFRININVMLIIYFYYIYRNLNTMINQDLKTNANGIPPKTWLVESILVTIFCCQISGIISIIYASRVESTFYRGDIVGAESASRTAKTLVLVSIALGVLGIVAIGAMAALGIFAGLYDNTP